MAGFTVRSARRTPWLVAIVVAGSLLGGACSGDLTELVVVVDTDFAVPAELDEIRIVVEGPSSMQYPQTATLTGPEAPSLPLYVYLEPAGDALGPVGVTATGRLGGVDVIERRASTFFVRGESRMLFLRLLRSCRGISCDMDSTCTEEGCAPVAVPAADLPPWRGSPPERDAGMDAGPECTPSPEECNGLDDDCDEMIDEDFDLTADPANCGGCGTACPADPLHASGSCTAGACVVSCDPGWADCDGDPATGCEGDLASPRSCGSCEVMCGGMSPLCNPTTGCVSGCSGTETMCADRCIDTRADPANCGDCGVVCPAPARATPTCAGGMCGLMCDSGFGDCDSDAGTGCETQLNTLMHCGGCGMACSRTNATATCGTGSCRIATCDPGFGNCDGADASGCEAPLTTLANCGDCGTPCAPANATGACGTGSCEIARCDPGFSDCDGNPDNGCETPDRMIYRDMDTDSFGDSAAAMTWTCGPLPAGWVDNPDDCDDSDPAVNPDATEICNRADDDCDGTPDDGLTACGDGCTNPWIITGDTFWMNQDFCSNVSTVPIDMCQVEDLSPIEVYEITLTTSTRIEVMVNPTAGDLSIFLLDTCWGSIIECQPNNGSIGRPLPPGTYFLAVAADSGDVCPGETYEIEILY